MMVERDAKLVEGLNECRQKLNAEAQILRSDAQDFLAGPADQRFDIVFVDPPYTSAIEPILQSLIRHIGARTRVYVERPADQGLPELESFQWLHSSRAGAICYGLATLSADSRSIAADAQP